MLPCGVPEVCLTCELRRWAGPAVGHDDRPCPSACSISSSRGCAAGWFCSAGHVMREGELGGHYQLIVEGSAAVTVRGIARRTLSPGDGFGEIALLRNIPRTATVTTIEPLRTLALQRDDFLAAVTGHPASAVTAEALVVGTLEADPRPGLTRKMEISWACGSRPGPSGPVRVCGGGMGQAAAAKPKPRSPPATPR